MSEKQGLKIAIIGSGSTYTPELIDGFIRLRETLPVRQFMFMDIDDRKRTIVGELCIRMLREEKMDSEAILTADLDEAVRDADYVITQIRVGKLPARILDETIPPKYGLLGQETTGIGGFMKAQRTIPVMCHIADRVRELAPEAFIINFTNPSGIITEAVMKHGFKRIIGLCNVPINMTSSVREQIPDGELTMDYVGLNHLSWIYHIEQDGRDITEEAIRQGVKSERMNNIPPSDLDREITAVAGAVYSPYLEYFYDREHKKKHNLDSGKCRGEECMEIEEQLLALYSEKTLCRKPELLNKRGGHRYSEVAVNLVHDLCNNTGNVNIVNVRNGDTLDFLEPDDVIEVACAIDRDGAHPLPLRKIDNTHIKTMMETVKEYERQTVNAGLTGDRTAALRAMVVHPLMGGLHHIPKVSGRDAKRQPGLSAAIQILVGRESGEEKETAHKGRSGTDDHGNAHAGMVFTVLVSAHAGSADRI